MRIVNPEWNVLKDIPVGSLIIGRLRLLVLGDVPVGLIEYYWLAVEGV